MTARIKGACACGAIKFEIHKPLCDVIARYCDQCRKLTGHYWAATTVPKESLVFQSNARLQWYQSSQQVRRGCCNIYGSNLFYDYEQRSEITISPGALEDHDMLSLTAYIFTVFKAVYYEICNHLPQHQQWNSRWSD